LKGIIVAHRGSSFEAPENTLASVNLAWVKDADAVEVDVHLSLDNRVVVIHDPDTKRTTGVRKEIKSTNYADLKLLDAGIWKGSEWQGEKIPLLQEVIDTLPPGKKLFVEIKGGLKCMEQTVKVLEESERDLKQFILMDFDLEVMKEAKKKIPRAKLLWLYEFSFLNSHEKNAIELHNIIDIAVTEGFNGINVENILQLNSEFIRKAAEVNLEVYCWTVDNVERAQYLIDSGIYGVTTNRPDYIKLNLLQ